MSEMHFALEMNLFVRSQGVLGWTLLGDIKVSEDMWMARNSLETVFTLA